MIKGRDIVIVGQQPWDVEIGSNCKNIAIEFSKHNRVLYVNAPLDRISLIKGDFSDKKMIKRKNVIDKKETGLIKLSETMWNLYPDIIIESINWIVIHSLFRLFNLMNNKRFAKSIRKAIEELEFENFILFNDNDMFRSFHLKELLKPSISVYYSRDFMTFTGYWKRHGESLEPKLIAKSDICVANSTYLAEYCRKFNPNSYYVGQGCELEVFLNYSSKKIPADILRITGIKIGYVGALNSVRLNKEIFLAIAKHRTDWSLILVGPEDDNFKKSDLHQYGNIYFLGAKDPSLLPNYIDSFDVCLNPQQINQLTIGNYPRKIDEYLAMGKPVVATNTPFMDAVFSKFTYLADTEADFIKLIEKAISEQSEIKINERKKFASSHSWENSVAAIYTAVEKHL